MTWLNLNRRHCLRFRLTPLVAVLAVIATVSGCTEDPRATRLVDVDLSNATALNRLGRALDPAERSALTTFAVRHRVASAGFCGKPLRHGSGTAPATVGEAIALTIQREREDARRDASKPPSAVAWEALTRDRDRLVDQQTRMSMQYGPSARRSAAWKALQRALEENGAAMLALRS